MILIWVKLVFLSFQIVEGVVNNLLIYLRSGEFEKALHTVIFISNLVNCRVVSSHSFLALLDNFMAVTVEQNIPQVWHASDAERSAY